MVEPHFFDDRNVPPTALILIGIVPEPKDMEYARVLGWYRIPARFAPKVVHVDYLAFYQPSSFGKGHDLRIETFAEVMGVELTSRRELIKNEPDHPRAEEEYYKIKIGQLHYLKNPIKAQRWKRITFLYTTGALFLKAESINDLVVKTEEREILWHSLREKAAQNQQYRQREISGMNMDPDLLVMLGELNLLKDESSWYLNI